MGTMDNSTESLFGRIRSIFSFNSRTLLVLLPSSGCTYKIRIWLSCDIIDSCKLRKDTGNTEFHVYKSQEQQRRRKKMGFPRQPQMRQKSTTAAAAALLTDVVLKVYRKVVQEMQQP